MQLPGVRDLADDATGCLVTLGRRPSHSAPDGMSWPGFSTLSTMPQASGLSPLQSYFAFSGGDLRSTKLNGSRTRLKPKAFWRSMIVTTSALHTVAADCGRHNHSFVQAYVDVVNCRTAASAPCESVVDPAYSPSTFVWPFCLGTRQGHSRLYMLGALSTVHEAVVKADPIANELAYVASHGSTREQCRPQPQPL